ncbi:MAG: putative lipid II flippase FtsW [Myxococcales bacterium]|nr:putative lipid II flippase FtsW [Myxococcales bacterium]
MSATKPTGGAATAHSGSMQAGEVDAVLAAVAVALVAFGVVMVFSASAVLSDRAYGDGTHYLVRQALYAVAGLVVMGTLSRIDYPRWHRLTLPLLAAVTLLLLAVLLGWGRTAGGATRWIALGPIHVQPAEAAKLVVVLWLARSLAAKRERIRTFSIGFLPHALVAGVLAALCLAQPDFGSALMIVLLTFILLFTAGARTGYLLGALLAALPLLWALVAGSPYRLRRIEAFLDPFAHRLDAGYQISESLLAFGAGGLTGVGLGDSRQKLFFLPEAHTDFIAAIVAEELGLLGVLGLLGAYALLFARGLRAALRAPDAYGLYLGIGATTFVGVQALTNLAVVTGLLPTKGLALPFVSYGGSSLLVNCAAVGLLLNLSRVRAADDGASRTAEAARATPMVRQHGRPLPRGATT